MTVTDGVVSVSDHPEKKVSYGDLIGGMHFNVKITARGYQTAMVVASEVQAKSYKDYKIVGTSVPRVDIPQKNSPVNTRTHRIFESPVCCMAARFVPTRLWPSH